MANIQLRQWRALTHKHFLQFRQSKGGLAQFSFLFFTPAIIMLTPIHSPGYYQAFCLINSVAMVYRMCEEHRLGLWHLIHKADVSYFVYLCSWLGFYAIMICMSYFFWFAFGSLLSAPFLEYGNFLPMLVTCCCTSISTFCALSLVTLFSTKRTILTVFLLLLFSLVMLLWTTSFEDSLYNKGASSAGVSRLFNPMQNFRKILRRMEHVVQKPDTDYTMGDMFSPGSEMKRWMCPDENIRGNDIPFKYYEYKGYGDRYENPANCRFVPYTSCFDRYDRYDRYDDCDFFDESCPSKECIAIPISDIDNIGFLVLQMVMYFAVNWYLFQVLVLKQKMWFMFQKHQRRVLSTEGFTLSIAGLKKRYRGSKILALNGVDLTAHSNQMLVLLGENGAGKTSLCDILVGKRTLSSGEVLLSGVPIHESGHKIAYVSQFDILFDALTPRQHLRLFCDLQDVSNISETVKIKLDELYLTEKEDTPVHALSGGTKRRVSLGLALVSNPTMVFLDEPTTGVDPLNRRRVWNVIEKLKLHRIVILTTHMMDEAEMLGDQIAILHKGKIEAQGTSDQLISNYGSGYVLRLTADPSFIPHISSQVLNHFQDIGSKKGLKIIDQSAGNLEIGLEETQLIKIPEFLHALESHETNAAMFIRDWSLTQSNLEEVFLALVSKRKAVQSDEFQSPVGNQSPLIGGHTSSPGESHLGGILGHTDPSGKITSKQQIRALVQLFLQLDLPSRPVKVFKGAALLLLIFLPLGFDFFDFRIVYYFGIAPICAYYTLFHMISLVLQLIRDKTKKYLFLMSMNRLQLSNYYRAQYGYYMLFQAGTIVLIMYYVYYVLRSVGFDGSLDWILPAIISCLCFSHAQFGMALIFGSYFSRPFVAIFAILALSFAIFWSDAFLIYLVLNWFGESVSVKSFIATALFGWIPPIGLGFSLYQIISESYGTWCLSQVVLWTYGSLFIKRYSAKFSQRLHPSEAQSNTNVGMPHPHARAPVIPGYSAAATPSGPPLEHKLEEVIQHQQNNEPAVLYDRVTKQFPSKLALNQLSMSMNYNECFGVLGPNGAGKTTAIGMLVGEIAPTSGNVFVNQCNIQTEWEKAVFDIGYVPQYDALFPSLTVSQHLNFYGRLKGIRETALGDWIKYILGQVCLGDSVHKTVSQLSGGQKRRVSLAIAILSNPKVMLLDEPTTGLDPSLKRKIWDIIETLKTDRCIVITTHAMEEVEVLCTRLSILVNGSVRCMGTTSQIRDIYGRKLQLQFKLQDETRLEELYQFMQKMSPTSELVTTYGNRRVFSLSRDGLNLLEVFDLIFRGKASGLFNEWNIGHVSIDETFCRIIAEAEEVERNEWSSG